MSQGISSLPLRSTKAGAWSSDRRPGSAGLGGGVGVDPKVKLQVPARMMAIVEQLVSTSAMSSEMMMTAYLARQFAQDQGGS